MLALSFATVGASDGITTQGKAAPSLTISCTKPTTSEDGRFELQGTGRWEDIREGAIFGAPVTVRNVTRNVDLAKPAAGVVTDSRTSGTIPIKANVSSDSYDPSDTIEVTLEITGRRMKVLAQETVECT